MFEKKKLWMMLATAALVTACGGSGGGGGDPAPSNPGGGSTTPDPALTGYLQVEEGNNLVFNNMMFPRSVFEDSGASGGIWGQTKGPNSAPLEAFGFVVQDTVQDSTVAQDAVGRIAFSLTEQAGSVATGEVAERMQFVLTNVRLATAADGTLSASLTEGAQLHVYGRNAQNEEVSGLVIADIPETVVSLADPSTLVEGGAPVGADSTALIIDLAAAFGAATAEQQTQLEALAALSGRFDMNVTLSAADIRAADGTTELVGEDITVTGSSESAVSGSGVSGNIWIDFTHPNQ